MVPSEELLEALKKLAPIAKGHICDLDIDWEDFGTTPLAKVHRLSGKQAKKNLPYDAVWVVSVLTIEAQRLCGGLLNEMDYRDKTYKGLPDDEYADRYRSECGEILGVFQADCQSRLEEVKRATAEGRYADI